jgi:DNA-binding CsgD family transcriptional regulator
MADRALNMGFTTLLATRRVGTGADGPEALLNTTTPAFVTDLGGHVLLWNRAMERLLDRPRKEALGRHCHDLLAGRDIFGNRFCHESCSVRCMMRKEEPVQGFDIVVPSRARGPQTFRVSILEVESTDADERRIVHLLTPAESPRSEETRSAPRPTGAAASGGNPRLTARENEILECVAAGLQNKEVAQKLGISVATARNHVHNILEKLEVHSKLEAVSLAFREGWVARQKP